MNTVPPRIIADGHVHVYPAYDPTAVFRHLIHNLDRLAGIAGIAPPGAPGHGFLKLAFLAEGRGHEYFKRLQDRDPAALGGGLEVLAGPEPACLTVVVRGAGRVCLVAGRQIVTRERLEILGLALCAPVPDGLPVADVIQRVFEAGGIPVLAWSPGKWLFARGRLVRELIEDGQGRLLCLGDSSLRPAHWPEPRLMQQARKRGMTVIPGSDPLPLAGEERYAGTYAFVCQGPFDCAQPAAAIRRMLTGPSANITPVGARRGTWTVAKRLWKLQTDRRRQAAGRPAPGN